jgi:chemotaxis protein CheX
MPMTPEELDLTQLVTSIWSTTLDLHVEPLTSLPPASASQPAMEAQIQIVGDWLGAVVVHAAPGLVARVAQRMFSLGDRPPSLNDMQDAFGEIANIIGGNIKGLLSDEGARLSLPTVVQGRDYQTSIPGTRQAVRGLFTCDGHPLVVTILRADVAVADSAAVGQTRSPATPAGPGGSRSPSRV